MKKALAIILSLIMLAGICITPVSAEAKTKEEIIPVIQVCGDSRRIYNKDGKALFSFRNLEALFDDDEDEEEGEDPITEAALNILMPFVVEGILTDNWTNYYDAVYKEFSDVTAELLPDKDGNITNGSDISSEDRNRMKEMYTAEYANKRINSNGTNNHIDDYRFFYDWRKDPLEIAVELNDHIENIKKATGANKVSLVGKCIGSAVVISYIAKYGTDSVYGLAMDGLTVNGSEALSESISGKFCFDTYAVDRLLLDLESFGYITDLDSFVTDSIKLAAQTGAVDFMKDNFKERIYYHIVEGITSALALSTFYAMPCYWAAVKTEDYDNALYYVFGPEGSEKRQEYAGLIEKIENYNVTVRQQLPNIMKMIHDECNLCIISKYGTQIAPVCESRNEIGDTFAAVNTTSFGATTSQVNATLSDSYIQSRINAGYGEYISPDNQIDASTCMFPECTWFVKGPTHSDWTDCENEIMMRVVTADHQVTPNEMVYSQFVVVPVNTDVGYAMTAENCHTESWAQTSLDGDNDVDLDTKEGKLTLLQTFINWLKSLFNFLKAKFFNTETV